MNAAHLVVLAIFIVPYVAGCSQKLESVVDATPEKVCVHTSFSNFGDAIKSVDDANLDEINTIQDIYRINGKEFRPDSHNRFFDDQTGRAYDFLFFGNENDLSDSEAILIATPRTIVVDKNETAVKRERMILFRDLSIGTLSDREFYIRVAEQCSRKMD